MSAVLLREEFLKSVTIVNRFIPLRPSLPVLGNALLKVSKGRLEFAATNLESSVYLNIPAKADGNWEITVPAKILSDFVSSASAKEVELELDKESLRLKSGEIVGTIAGIAASEFPKLPESEEEEASFAYTSLQEAINAVVFAASNDQGKPILTGVLISEKEGETVIVATDGYRLAHKTLVEKHQLGDLVLPAKTLVEALRLAGEMEQTSLALAVSQEKNQVLFQGDNFRIASRLLDGTYPQFQQIIPTKFVSEFTIDRNQLIAAIKATAVFARDIGNVVKLEVGKEDVALSATTAQVGEASAKVSGSNKGEALKVAFNSRYLLDGLAVLKSDQIELKFSGPASAAMIADPKNSDFFYIVMPVKPQ